MQLPKYAVVCLCTTQALYSVMRSTPDAEEKKAKIAEALTSGPVKDKLEALEKRLVRTVPRAQLLCVLSSGTDIAMSAGQEAGQGQAGGA